MKFQRTRPLIVCGFVRSGTQMCATILSNSLVVELQGEIPISLTRPTFVWLQAVKREQQHEDARLFYRLCRTTLRGITPPSSNAIRRDARWFGHKTPRHENYFDIYEKLFDHPEARPCYVYCLRNPFHVWQSYRVMPWNGWPGVRRFLKGWVKSVEAFEAMRAVAQDRVFLFHLDEMLASADQLTWLQKTMLDGLEIEADTFRKPVESLRNNNSAQAKFGLAPPEVPIGELAYIARDRRVRRIIDQYFPELEDEARRLSSATSLRLFGNRGARSQQR